MNTFSSSSPLNSSHNLKEKGWEKILSQWKSTCEQQKPRSCFCFYIYSNVRMWTIAQQTLIRSMNRIKIRIWLKAYKKHSDWLIKWFPMLWLVNQMMYGTQETLCLFMYWRRMCSCTQHLFEGLNPFLRNVANNRLEDCSIGGRHGGWTLIALKMNFSNNSWCTGILSRILVNETVVVFWALLTYLLPPFVLINRCSAGC